jgi:DNA-binding HxlR family transcriptional regulator
MLSERLRLLAKAGFISRHYEPTIPPAVTYELTARSAEINKVLEALEKLAQGWKHEEAQNMRPTSIEAEAGGKSRQLESQG